MKKILIILSCLFSLGLIIILHSCEETMDYSGQDSNSNPYVDVIAVDTSDNGSTNPVDSADFPDFYSDSISPDIESTLNYTYNGPLLCEEQGYINVRYLISKWEHAGECRNWNFNGRMVRPQPYGDIDLYINEDGTYLCRNDDLDVIGSGTWTYNTENGNRISFLGDDNELFVTTVMADRSKGELVLTYEEDGETVHQLFHKDIQPSLDTENPFDCELGSFINDLDDCIYVGNTKVCGSDEFISENYLAQTKKDETNGAGGFEYLGYTSSDDGNNELHQPENGTLLLLYSNYYYQKQEFINNGAGVVVESGYWIFIPEKNNKLVFVNNEGEIQITNAVKTEDGLKLITVDRSEKITEKIYTKLWQE